MPATLFKVARRKLDYLQNAYELEDLRSPPGNRLERLKGDLKEKYSIRINDQYRIVFRFVGHDAYEVQIVDYHEEDFEMYKLQRMPTHPGEILREEFLEPLGMTQSALAKAIHSSFRSVNELVNEKRGITPEMALKLSRYFRTTPQLWMSLQNEYDLYKTLQKKEEEIESIETCTEIDVA